MALYKIPRGGPSPMESIGGAGSKLAQAFLQAKMLKRKTQQEDVQTGQDTLQNYIALSNIYGPDILKSPGFQAVAQKAGMGGLEIPESVEGALGAEIPEGHDVTRTYGAFGRPKGTTVKAPSGADKLNRWRLEQLGKMTPEQQQKYLLKPSVNIEMGKPASPGERTDIAAGRASLDALDNLKTLFDSVQTKTGPVIGRLAPTKGLFGLTTDEQEAFMAATSAFKNAIIKEITGAQMSEQEAERIMKQVPDITDPSARWKAKWMQSKKNLEFLQKRRLEVLGQSGLRVPQVGGKESDVYISNPFRSDSFPTAINPETGKRLILINNKWVPAEEK